MRILSVQPGHTGGGGLWSFFLFFILFSWYNLSKLTIAYFPHFSSFVSLSLDIIHGFFPNLTLACLRRLRRLPWKSFRYASVEHLPLPLPWKCTLTSWEQSPFVNRVLPRKSSSTSMEINQMCLLPWKSISMEAYVKSCRKP